MQEVKDLLPTLVETPMIESYVEEDTNDVNADILSEMNSFAI